MGRYCTWSSDVLIRYPELTQVGSGAGVESHFIAPVEDRLDMRLARGFTVPFSSNNKTAKDLAIDMTYLLLARANDPDRAKLISDHVDETVKGLLSGDLSMLTSGGDALATVGETVWSSTQTYHPIFGMGETLDFAVDSDRIGAEDDARD